MIQISSFLHKESPKHLFVCADKDPKETHHKCLTIIRDAILPPSIQFVWFYMSAWDTFDNYSLANCKVYFEKSKFYKKILSIALHHSQNPPKIHYGNPISFMEVAKKKDKSQEHFNYFKEQFYVVKVSEIKSAANHILTMKNNPVRPLIMTNILVISLLYNSSFLVLNRLLVHSNHPSNYCLSYMDSNLF